MTYHNLCFLIGERPDGEDGRTRRACIPVFISSNLIPASLLCYGDVAEPGLKRPIYNRCDRVRARSAGPNPAVSALESNHPTKNTSGTDALDIG